MRAECVLIWLRINSRFACTRWKFKTGILQGFFSVAVKWLLTAQGGFPSAGSTAAEADFHKRLLEVPASLSYCTLLACVCMRGFA